MTFIRLPDHKDMTAEDAAAPEPMDTLQQFLAMLKTIPWFGHVGEPMNSEHRCLAVDYLAAIGFTECSPAYLKSWEEAADVCLGLDSESPWRMEEERLMELLGQQAEEAVGGPEALQTILTEIAAALSRLIPSRLNVLDSDEPIDDGLRDAAFGSAAHATQMTALMILAQQFDTPEALEHPAAIRFRIFELGHWPMGVVGQSFMVF